MLFSFVFCLVVITALRRWDKILAIVRQTRLFLTLGVAGMLIFINWQVYVLAVLAGHVTEAALGYFINPIVTVLLGVLLLREKLRPAQWAAVGAERRRGARSRHQLRRRSPGSPSPWPSRSGSTATRRSPSAARWTR